MNDVNQETINDYYREQGQAALATARAKLDAAGLNGLIETRRGAGYLIP